VWFPVHPPLPPDFPTTSPPIQHIPSSRFVNHCPPTRSAPPADTDPSYLFIPRSVNYHSVDRCMYIQSADGCASADLSILPLGPSPRGRSIRLYDLRIPSTSSVRRDWRLFTPCGGHRAPALLSIRRPRPAGWQLQSIVIWAKYPRIKSPASGTTKWHFRGSKSASPRKNSEIDRRQASQITFSAFVRVSVTRSITRQCIRSRKPPDCGPIGYMRRQFLDPIQCSCVPLPLSQ
jgi:hypothetical protein